MELGTSLLLLRIVKLVLEICLLALVGQGIVFVLVRGIGQDAKRNFFYRVLETVSSPFVKLARYITPRFVPDRHLPLVEKLMGALLVVTGVMFLTGTMQTISYWLLELFPSLASIG